MRRSCRPCMRTCRQLWMVSKVGKVVSPAPWPRGSAGCCGGWEWCAPVGERGWHSSWSPDPPQACLSGAPEGSLLCSEAASGGVWPAAVVQCAWYYVAAETVTVGTHWLGLWSDVRLRQALLSSFVRSCSAGCHTYRRSIIYFFIRKSAQPPTVCCKGAGAVNTRLLHCKLHFLLAVPARPAEVQVNAVVSQPSGWRRLLRPSGRSSFANCCRPLLGNLLTLQHPPWCGTACPQGTCACAAPTTTESQGRSGVHRVTCQTDLTRWYPVSPTQVPPNKRVGCVLATHPVRV